MTNHRMISVLDNVITTLSAASGDNDMESVQAYIDHAMEKLIDLASEIEDK